MTLRMKGRASGLVLRRIRLAAGIVIASAAGGALYGFAANGGHLIGAARGIVTGACIGAVLVAFELLYVRNPAGRWIRRLSFVRLLATKSAIYFSVFALVLIGSSVLFSVGPERSPLVNRDFAPSMAFSAAFAVVITFVMQVDRLLGRGVLASFVTGRYHRPREEERIFLFLDLVGSTSLAERLGGPRFLDLLNRIYHDIADPILEHRADIHKYVGDEVIVTWPHDTGIANANCVRCAFAIIGRITAHAEEYERAFGVVPSFRAGLHVGTVVSGELGDIKQEIAFLGDPMNTTSRLIDACREFKRSCIASGDLVDRLSMPPKIATEPLGSIQLRGRRAALDLFALSTSG
jgi:adenylate cyclase